MCLAIPALITRIDEGNIATVDIMGITKKVALDLTPQAKEGDYVLVHAGFAIEIVDRQYADETIELIKEFPQLAEDFS
ncbi:MAG: HypC/HybG/HupF family hydrogenase formation chaperone [Eggerthellaceae bacterium]|nr:HypC/HybG/HupF family hydrogenase formation chaperone [Eggerthellaceae bacterium]